jgi:SPP1 gp7 family putative phage head morphogenesis protein
MTKEELRRLQRKNNRYWQRREMRQRMQLFNKSVTELDGELERQYRRVGKIIEREFLSTIEELRNKEGVILPSDMYKSKRYYQMLNEVNSELDKLALKDMTLIEDKLLDVYEKQSRMTAKDFGLYYSIDKDAARTVIRETWCSDGRDLSQRIWRNRGLLMQKLEDGLFEFVTRGQPTAQLVTDLITEQTGQSAADLKNILDDDFREAYNNAKRLVRTETARVQTRATQDRYKEAGFTKWRVIAEPDCCEVCADLAEQVFDIDELVIPAHPNCRCAMAAITESLE